MEVMSTFNHALGITFLVFAMMLLVDALETSTRGRISNLMQGSQWRQYTLASFLGSTPGCLGAFMNVTLYIHGMISLGALVGGMVATSGDEAFVMLSQFPGPAAVLFILLFVCGVIFAWLSDKIVRLFGIATSQPCDGSQCGICFPEETSPEDALQIHGIKGLMENIRKFSVTRFLLMAGIAGFLVLVLLGIVGSPHWDWKRMSFLSLGLCALLIAGTGSEHYVRDHIWDHILKRHLLRVFLWAFTALVFVHWGVTYLNLDLFIRDHMVWVLLLSGLIGVVPESGPHLIFVMMYAGGIVPFSVLFTTSFVQDGHGMLPLLSYSLRDCFLVKAMNLVFGVGVGAGLYFFGF